ncbi:MAG TPA: sigma-54 dependent transcriptional regulator [Candidatus Acidoferrales bacterium]|nr:sigma-54 dependent transcriptional regulator [Candidatus Acidoferrales bacterium]
MSCAVPPIALTDELDLPPEELIFGASRAMQAVRREVEHAAMANVPVLIDGQSGTGKEVVAKLIHRHSPGGQRAFVKVNCPAIPGTLLESELFGYEKGAFTGAYAVKPGRVEAAEGGTLFLDEIAELEPAIQAKLLQLLQDGRFCRIGGRHERQVELRVACATNHDLADDVRAGVFRRDLFYRINVLAIHLPPLAERREDIPALARFLAEKYSAKYGRPAPAIGKRILRMLEARPWPGNIRELENVMKRYVILGSDEAFDNGGGNGHGNGSGNGDGGGPKPGAAGERAGSLKTIVRQAVRDLERDLILHALETNRWNRRVTARGLGISYAALLYKMREAGVPPMRGPRAAKIPEPADSSPSRRT